MEDIEKENKALLCENDFLQQSERSLYQLNLLYLEEINNCKEEIKSLSNAFYSMELKYEKEKSKTWYQKLFNV